MTKFMHAVEDPLYKWYFTVEESKKEKEKRRRIIHLFLRPSPFTQRLFLASSAFRLRSPCIVLAKSRLCVRCVIEIDL